MTKDEALKLAREHIEGNYTVSADEALAAIKEALAQPEQEPVTWRNAAIRVGEDLCSVGPFGYYDMTAKQWLDWALSVVTVHAPPPQRKPLTDEQIWQSDAIMSANSGYGATFDTLRELIRAIEAAHGIKEKA